MTGVGAIFELYEHLTEKRDKKKAAKQKSNLKDILKEQQEEDDAKQALKKQQQSIGYRIDERTRAMVLKRQKESEDNPNDDRLKDGEEFFDEALHWHACIKHCDWDALWELLTSYDFQLYKDERDKYLAEKKVAKPKRRLRVVRGAITVKNFVLPKPELEEEEDQLVREIISPLLGCDNYGRSPLHSVCAVRAISDRIILRMLQSEKLAAKILDDHEQLPLHIATRHGKSIKVMDKLMRSNIPGISQEDGAGRTSLWYCVQRTILTAEYGEHDGIADNATNEVITDADAVDIPSNINLDKDATTHTTATTTTRSQFQSIHTRSYYHDDDDDEDEDDDNATTAYFMEEYDGNVSSRNLLNSSRNLLNNSTNKSFASFSTSSFSLNFNSADKSIANNSTDHSVDNSSAGKQPASSLSLRSTRSGKSGQTAQTTSSMLLSSKIHKIKFTSIENDPYAKTTWGIPRTQQQMQWQERQEQHWSKARFMLSAYSARRKIFKPSERELLLWVIDHAAPPSVIEVALFASQKLLQTDPTLASAAMHLFMRRQYPIKNLHLLLHHFPIQNLETMEAARRLLTKYYTAGCVSTDDGKSFQYELEQKAINQKKPSLACAEWWDKCTALLRLCGHENVAEHKAKFVKKEHLLHAALCNPETPPSMVQLLMALQPKSIALEHPFKKDASLIHLVCKYWKYNLYPHFVNTKEPPMGQIVRLLLAADRSQTRKRFEQRLPIHHAIASCKSWEFLESLISIDRLTLAQRDPITKLYPFQLAATLDNNKNAALWAHGRNPDDWTHMTPKQRATQVQIIIEEQELEQMSIVFELLRAFPQAVYSGAALSKPAVFRDSTGKGMVSAHYIQFCYKRIDAAAQNATAARVILAMGGGKVPMGNRSVNGIKSKTKDASKRSATEAEEKVEEQAERLEDIEEDVEEIDDGELAATAPEWVMVSPNYELIRHAIDIKTIPPKLEPWWERLKFWIWYCYPKELGEICKTPTDSFLLHAALANEDTPPIVIQLILAVYPLSASLPTFGMYGTFEYPLHIAARTPTYLPQDFEEPHPFPVLDLVLREFPEAAQVQNSQGLPIHIAAELGKTWDELHGLVEASNAQNNAIDTNMTRTATNDGNQNNNSRMNACMDMSMEMSMEMSMDLSMLSNFNLNTSHNNVAPTRQRREPEPAALPPPSPVLEFVQSSTSQAWEDLRRNLASINLGYGGADGGSSADGGSGTPYGQLYGQQQHIDPPNLPNNMLGPMAQEEALSPSTDDSSNTHFTALKSFSWTDAGTWSLPAPSTVNRNEMSGLSSIESDLESTSDEDSTPSRSQSNRSARQRY